MKGIRAAAGESIMPVHDWARVEAGIFHDFHNAWVIELRNLLNGGVLPEGYYALTEQHAGRYITDLLTLHASAAPHEPHIPPDNRGLALAEAPPKVRRKLTSGGSLRRLRRTLAIRHISGHHLIALIEIVSPANKDRAEHVQEFVAKAVTAVEHGIHLLLLDLFLPGPHDRRGMHAAVWEHFDDEPFEPPTDEPLTLASYNAGPAPDAFVEHAALGGVLPDMPLVLRGDRSVQVRLEPTYQAAFRGFPAFWRDVLDGHRQADA
jgi:hypothetical protein